MLILHLFGRDELQALISKESHVVIVSIFTDATLLLACSRAEGKHLVIEAIL